MGKRRKIQDDVTFEKLWRDPENRIGEIADYFFVSTHCARMAAVRLKLPSSKEIGRLGGSQVSAKKVEAARQMWVRGIAAADIAAAVKMTGGTIYAWSDKFDWPKRKLVRGPSGPRKVKAAGTAIKRYQSSQSSLNPATTASKGPRMPSAAVLAAAFTLRRLDAPQIAALAESGGRYQALIDLADAWGKGRVFLQQCWNEYHAGVVL